MRLFTKTKKRGRPRKTPKTLSQIASDAVNKALAKDEELAKDIGFHQAGLADLVRKETETEKQQKKINEFITKRAFEELQSGESELLEDAIRDKVSSILGSGEKRRHGKELPEYLEGGGFSSLSESLREYLEAKRTLSELAESEGGSSQGFFKGMSMKDLLEALPYVAAMMGKGEAPTQVGRTYIIRINGQDKEVTESQYKQLAQEGKLQPVAMLTQPEPEKKEIPKEPELLKGDFETEKIPELPLYLQGIDFTIIEGWLDQEPEDFVANLKDAAEAGTEESKLALGFLGNTTLEAINHIITPYREHLEIGYLVERILNEDGQAWLTQVLQLI